MSLCCRFWSCSDQIDVRERWLMEGAYNKVYRARERVPREEFGFLLERLMGTVRYVIQSKDWYSP